VVRHPQLLYHATILLATPLGALGWSAPGLEPGPDGCRTTCANRYSTAPTSFTYQVAKKQQ
jgi:hypothetical protein